MKKVIPNDFVEEHTSGKINFFFFYIQVMKDNKI